MDDSRLRSRRRATRALAEKRRRGTTGVSGDEESPTRERAKPPRRKKKDPIFEEDVIDGFAIMSFKTFEDIEISLKGGKGATNGTLASIQEEVVLIKQEVEEKPDKQALVTVVPEKELKPQLQVNNIKPVPIINSIEKQDPGTSDENSREKDKPRVIKREAESEVERLSDASSRCSSGKGYLCDSEDDDDKGSDSGSVLFSASPPPGRKHEPPTGEVTVNGHGVSSPPRKEPPTSPTPVPQQVFPSQIVTNGVTAKTERVSPPPVVAAAAVTVASNYQPTPAPTQTTPSGYPHSHQHHSLYQHSHQHPHPHQHPHAHSHPHSHPGPIVQPPPIPTVATVHHQQPPIPPVPPVSYHPPLYAPYSSTPYLPPVSQRVNRSPIGLKPVTTCPIVTTTTTSHREMVNTAVVGRSHSPRGHSPTRERESYSSNVSSLSRGSVGTPVSLPPYHPPPQSSLAYNKPSGVWVSSSSGGAPRLSHPQFPAAPMFTAPAPPPVSAAAPPPPNPFSAESLFQSTVAYVEKQGSLSHRSSRSMNQGDLLRRELDSRFLASQDRGPYIRTEMHHHQHQHTHVHQHTTPIIPPPPPTLFTPPIFKEMPKGAGGMESPFYRAGMGFSGYPGYSPGLLHPGFGPSTPFTPPAHLATFTPKRLFVPTEPKIVQLTEPTKPKTVKAGKWNAMHVRVAWEIYHHQQKSGGGSGGGPGSLEAKVASLPKDPLRATHSHMFAGAPFAAPHRPPFEPPPPASAYPPTLGGSMFGRYATSAPSFSALPSFPHPGAPPMHDPWARLGSSRVGPGGFPPSGPWGLKPEPSVEEKSRERERERERDRARREEKNRRLMSGVAAKGAAAGVANPRDRSPLRTESTSKEEAAYLSRSAASLRPPPPPHPHHFPPPPPPVWDHPHYRYDPLRFNPLMSALREEEAKLFYPGLRGKEQSPHQPKEEPSQSR